MASPRWWLGLAALTWLAVCAGRADDVPPRSGGEPAPRGTESPRSSTPGSSAISQKEHQDLLDELARLRAQLKSDRPESPSRCKVAGRIAGDIVELALEYEFRTYQTRARVALGCAQGFPSQARLDGHPALLRWGPEGLIVQVEEAGDHKVLLHMELPLLSRDRAVERGFDLDLPAAPTTTLDTLELPGWVKKVHGQITLRDGPTGRQVTQGEFRTAAVSSSGAEACCVKTPGLGPVERLELTWEGQPPVPGARPLLTVENSQVAVRVDDRYVTTRADLTLAVRRGEAVQWQLLLPPQAILRPPENDERIEAIETSESRKWLRTIRLKRPTAEPLTVSITVQHLRQGPPASIGPFVVVGATPQRGDILISAPLDMTLNYRTRGEALYVLTERELTDDEKRRSPTALAFRYGVLATPDKDPVPSFLDLDADPIKGVVEARVNHVLRLVEGDTVRPPAWRIATTIEGRAFHSDLEQLQLQMPIDFEFDSKFGLAPAGEVQGLEWVDPGKRIAQVALTPRRKGPFKVILEGRYSPLLLGTNQAILELPAPLNTLDRGCQVNVVVPEDLELVPLHPGPLWENSKREGYNRRTWILESQPDQFGIAWQPYRPDLAVDGKVHLTLSDRQASVRHEMWLPPGQVLPGSFSLQVPEQVHNLAVVPTTDNPPRLDPHEGRSRAVVLAVPPDRDHPLVLEYSVPLRPEEPGTNRFPIALVVPEQATRGETRVLVWADPGRCPVVVDGRWEQRLEEVRGVARFPALVLLARQPVLPLILSLSETAGPVLPACRVQKAQIQVTVDDNGQQFYRARYLLTQVGTPFLDLELPAALFQPNPPHLKILFRNKEATWKAVDDNGSEISLSKVGRIQLEPGQGGEAGVLEVDYVLTSGRIAGSNAFRSILHPPLLRRETGLTPIRWHVLLPPTWVSVYHEGSFGLGCEWEWRNWLLAPYPALTPSDRAWRDESEQETLDNRVPQARLAAVCWRWGAEPLHLTHVPQQVWLLLCSFAVLLIGLCLTFLALPRLLFWAMLTILGVGTLVLGLFWPGVLAVVLYGCQPGLLVLVPLVGVHWGLQRHYRRQVIFLPSFARTKTAPVVGRSSSSRPHGQPSTVDVPMVPLIANTAQQSPVSGHQSAVSNQQSAVGSQQSAVSSQQSAVSGQMAPDPPDR